MNHAGFHMEGSKLKTSISASDFEVETLELDLQAKTRALRKVNSSRVALTAVALVAGLTALSLSADTLRVYENTHVPAEYMLPLWPDEFDIRPTVALVAGSVVVVIANTMSLFATKLRVHSALSNLAAPIMSFVATLVAICLFYAVNPSTTVDTVQSWSCRWRNVVMFSAPYFGTLCKESEVGLALAVFLVPLEAIVLLVAAWQRKLQRQLDGMVGESLERKRVSPSFS